nr:hypothetical protein F35E8.5 - Caenorhabditis elegans [Caenorhabditis elegans]
MKTDDKMKGSRVCGEIYVSDSNFAPDAEYRCEKIQKNFPDFILIFKIRKFIGCLYVSFQTLNFPAREFSPPTKPCRNTNSTGNKVEATVDNKSITYSCVMLLFFRQNK